MSLLVWDAVGSRIYENGLSKGVLYPQSNGTYPIGYAWNGLSSVNESPSGGDLTDIYADDMLYVSIRAIEKYGATIEAYTYPPEFAACLGLATLVLGAKIGQQTRTSFGVCYKTLVNNDEGEETYKLNIIYGASASPSEQTHNSLTDSPDVSPFSWEITTVPVLVTGHKPTASLVIDSATANPTKLAALEAILYGSSGADARLPLPDEILTLLTPA